MIESELSEIEFVGFSDEMLLFSFSPFFSPFYFFYFSDIVVVVVVFFGERKFVVVCEWEK